MATINYSKVQAAFDALNPVQRNLNELKYYKKLLKDANHSTSLCTAVCSSIDKLLNLHQNLLEMLALYGYGHLQKDAELASVMDSDYSADNLPVEFTYTPAPEHQKGFWEKTANQIVLGDYTEDVTWLGTGVSFVLALFGVDAPMDARDLTANVQKGEYGWAVVNALSLLPVLGVFCKGAKAIDTSTTLLKQGSNVIDATATGAKAADNSVSIYKGYKVLTQTGEGNIYLNHLDEFVRIDVDGKIIKTKNMVLVEDYNFVLNSAEKQKHLRYAFNGSNMTADEARAMFGGKSDAYLKGLGYDDAAIDVIRKGGVPEKARDRFLKSLAEDEDSVKAIREYLEGLNWSPDRVQKAIDDLAAGKMPSGANLSVHHKKPIKDSGDNSLDNFVLIDSQSHGMYTGYQNSITKNIDDSVVLDWPEPKGKVCLSEYSEVNIADIESEILDMLKK